MSNLITKLNPNEVFVFGSNLAGRHGKGAAKQAQQWGAVRGKGIGHFGQTYGIPTKDGRYSCDRELKKILPLRVIQVHVDTFLTYAKANPQLTFLVTEIGCGLAGYAPARIAPLFAQAINEKNIVLPAAFLNSLRSTN